MENMKKRKQFYLIGGVCALVAIIAFFFIVFHFNEHSKPLPIKLPKTAEIEPNTLNLMKSFANCYLSQKKSTPEILAIAEKNFKLEDLPLSVQYRYARIERDSYDRQKKILNEIALRLIAAKDKSLTVSPKVGVPDIGEIYPEKMKITLKELKEFYKKNKHSFPREIGFERLQPALKRHLLDKKKRAILEELNDKTQAENKITWKLALPCTPNINLGIFDFPRLGSENAPIQLAYVSRYFCSQCRILWPKIDRVIKKYGEKIALRPLLAIEAEGTTEFEFAKGAYCASKQGAQKFSDFQSAAYRTSINMRRRPAQVREHILNSIVVSSHLHPKIFKQCYDSEEAVAFAKKNLEIFGKLGLSELPALFANNKIVFLDLMGEDWVAFFEKIAIGLK